jgi:hypothetical protein
MMTRSLWYRPRLLPTCEKCRVDRVFVNFDVDGEFLAEAAIVDADGFGRMPMKTSRFLLQGLFILIKAAANFFSSSLSLCGREPRPLRVTEIS